MKIFGFAGYSGSGKTTLLSMLGGMLAPTNGQVWLDGRSVYAATATHRAQLRLQKIGFVFQTFNLVPYLSALENVQVPLMLSRLWSAEAKRRVAELLARVGLEDRMHHKPSELSVGQQQRVALARTLANDPPVILADEPTGNLDSKTGEEIMELFEKLHAEGNTIILVTHEHDVAERAHRIITIRDGRIETDEQTK